MNIPTLGSFGRRFSNPWNLGCALALIAMAAAGQAIRNESLEARFDAAADRLTVRERAGGRVILDQALLSAEGGRVTTQRITDPVRGAGWVMEIQRTNVTDRITVHDGMPFVFLQPIFHNPTTSVLNRARIGTLSGTVLPAVPGGELKAWGTAGLTAPDQHPGSYAFLALADPKTRQGLVAAWLTHDRGSGILFSGLDSGRATLRAQLDYGRLLIPPGVTVTGEVLAVGAFADVRKGLEQWAGLVARQYQIHLPPQLDGYCTWYSNPHGGAADEKSIVQLAEAAARELKPFGFDFVQIDDYWQEGKRRNGPAKVFLQHNPTGPYPNGMAGPAEKIRALGLTPGLWFMPFAGDADDPWFADKQHWFAHDAGGKPYRTAWGGDALDQTHPEVRAYLSNVVHRIAHEWGYTYFKMDGMWMGTATKQIYVNNAYRGEDDLGIPAVYDPSQTPIEAYRNGLKLIRQVAGTNVFILGCCVSQNMRSFGGTFGCVDAMRIGPDNGGNWESIKVGPWHAGNRYFLHGRVWYNDPDPCYIRASMPTEQARTICSWVGFAGMLQASSDWLPASSPERLNLLKRILPSHGKVARPADILEREMANFWTLQDTRGDAALHAIGIFNWDANATLTIERGLEQLDLDPARTYIGFDFWANTFVPPFRGTLRGSVPPGDCRILSLREAAPHPVLVGTSRHITQGLVDVLEEHWDAKTGILSGRSRVVAGDRYELRVIVPTGDSYLLTGAALGGTKADMEQVGPQIRAGATPTTSGDVVWKLTFRRGRVDAMAAVRPAKLVATSSWQRVVLSWSPQQALGYRVERSDGKSWEVILPEFLDTRVAPGAQYTYRVSARGWDATWSAPAEATVQLPAKLALPPVPPAPQVALSALKPVSYKTDWGSLQLNKSAEGKPLTLGGTVYPNGIGTHANATTVYTIPAGMKRFVATVGLDDEKADDPRASIALKVYGDVKEMGEKPQLLAESPVLSNGVTRIWHFDVPLQERHRELRLVAEDAGNGINCDHADWVNAGFRSE